MAVTHGRCYNILDRRNLGIALGGIIGLDGRIVEDYWTKMMQMNELENLCIYKLILELGNGTLVLDDLWVLCACVVRSGVDIRSRG